MRRTPKEGPTKMPVITPDYNNNNTLEPEVSYPDDTWEEEAARVFITTTITLNYQAY